MTTAHLGPSSHSCPGTKRFEAFQSVTTMTLLMVGKLRAPEHGSFALRQTVRPNNPLIVVT